MRPDKIALSADGALDLPAPQRTEVRFAASDSVEMRLYCPTADSAEEATPVSVPLPPAMARELAIRLWLAADGIEFPRK